MKTGPKHIAEVLRRHLARRGYAQEQSAAELNCAWREVVGLPYAAHTRAVGVRRGALEVVCGSATALSELRGFHQEQLLRRLAEALPAANIRAIRFRAGAIVDSEQG